MFMTYMLTDNCFVCAYLQYVFAGYIETNRNRDRDRDRDKDQNALINDIKPDAFIMREAKLFNKDGEARLYGC